MYQNLNVKNTVTPKATESMTNDSEDGANMVSFQFNFLPRIKSNYVVRTLNGH